MLHPITFSIPECKIVSEMAVKTKILATIIPGDLSTYIYNNETDYYNDYKTSIFALTTKKAGWDCIRHYEIIASGCIPYFPEIKMCPRNTMTLFPKDLIIKGNEIYEEICRTDGRILHHLLPDCYELIQQLLDYMKTHLTTRSMASYILEKSGHSEAKKILYLSNDISPDYLRCLTLHGLKELLGNECHDYPMPPHLYKIDHLDCNPLYGKGFTYSKLLDPALHNYLADYTIQQDIVEKKYDIVIYGSYHRGMPLYDLVSKYYTSSEIILLCGEDIHHCDFQKWVNKGHHVFVREL